MLDIVGLSTDLIGPVSLSVAESECLAILGASGAGKSLLLRAIADLDPNEGQVTLTGRNRNRMPADAWRRLVALVPAESGWWADRVSDHFDAGSDPSAILESVDLPHALDWDVSRLSTGERHRLAIARALQAEPQALLLDEPTAALDADATEGIEKLLKRQCERGVAILLVTHDLDQAKRLASRTMTMHEGRLRPTQGSAA